MAGKVYKLGLPSGARIDVEQLSLVKALEGARVKGGDIWLAGTPVTSGAFEVDLEQPRVFADVVLTGVLAFAPSSARRPYQYSMIAVTADGTNIPTFVGFTKWGGSFDYDNTALKVNYIMFFSDGIGAYYSIIPAA